jgi:hypothetical protein
MQMLIVMCISGILRLKWADGGIANLLCRGIDVVRNKIKMFAQKKVTLPPGRHKIVLLDEADRCGI